MTGESATNTARDITILSTKLYVPPVRPELVPRLRLLRQLDEGLCRRLSLISAPAGFGKTTLLSEWIRHRDGLAPPVKVAWLSLDEGDNDPARFLAYLSAALQTAGAAVEHESGGAWGSLQPSAPEAFLTALINQVGALSARLVLVLDDYHLVAAPAIHRALSFLLAYLPDNLHLAISTRADPPLSLARLRARGQLIELRQHDLRFTAEEAAAFLNRVMGLGLSAEDVAALEARTEGWIAGLQMAALAIQPLAVRATAEGLPKEGVLAGDQAQPSEFVRAFTGSHRFVLDYLVEEVLEQQSPGVQQFLLRTSILQQMTAPLCDALLDEPGKLVCPSQSILEQLEAANLFIVPLDDERRWYRYHRLFADLLRKRLRQTCPTLVPDLHRRASEWCERHGLMGAAIDHALWQGDSARAADLIETIVEATFMRSEVVTVLEWVERLPEHEVRARPSLCVYHAWALLLGGRPWEAVEARLEDVACLEANAQDHEVTTQAAALRAYVALFQGDIPRAAALSRQALAELPEEKELPRSIALWNLGLLAMSDGDAAQGQRALEEVVRRSRASGNVMVAVMVLCNLAELRMKQGRLRQAQEIYQQALQTATDERGQRLPIAGEALIGLGELARQWNDLEGATRHIQDGMELIEMWGKVGRIEGLVGLSRVKQSQGDLEAAQALLERARHLAIQFDATDLDDQIVDQQQVRLWIASGQHQTARRWAEGRAFGQEVDSDQMSAREAFLRSRMLKYEQLTLARLLIAEGKPDEALALLNPLVARFAESGRHDLSIEGSMLQALALQAQGELSGAVEALARALALAEPEGYVRIFLDEGEPMAWLLRHAASRGILPHYTSQLLAACGTPGSEQAAEAGSHALVQPLVEPLSERELEVLRLLAAGLSNPEIADELVVAVSTVRSHCKSIYGKLNVHRRWDAVQRAGELGLL